MFDWLWKKKAEPASTGEVLADILDRLRFVERAQKGLEADYKDLGEGLEQRFGRVWAALKRRKSDEPTGDTDEVPAAPTRPPSVMELRQRFLTKRGG